jgi:hypothetical protein
VRLSRVSFTSTTAFSAGSLAEVSSGVAPLSHAVKKSDEDATVAAARRRMLLVSFIDLYLYCLLELVGGVAIGIIDGKYNKREY